MTLEALLEEALQIVRGRRDMHGEAERSFEAIAALWTGYLCACGYENMAFQAIDVARMMALMKLARRITGAAKRDSYVDGIGYLLNEAALEGYA